MYLLRTPPPQWVHEDGEITETGDRSKHCGILLGITVYQYDKCA
eukprot:CAMPEP_0177655628 /NCGR_PEP_ID=MMETSP0447-20121125/15085_1 /TAXON_ID=0 /ORGANISM="Stygamoeba regulata, Strain BSH-02190019" /LENGTH=43 /DNA_ID= /DNA_START= /DNA_END= /DNA_ORIENTATION=